MGGGSKLNRAIPYTSLGAVNPDLACVGPGDVYYPDAGGLGLLMVYRESGGGLNAVNLLSNRQFTAVFTPSSSGDGVLAIVCTDTLTGLPLEDELIDFDIISAGNLTSIGISGGIGTLNAVLGTGTVSMVVHAQTNAAGRVDLAINGTASQAYRVVITARAGSGVNNLFKQVLTGTLPA